MGAVLLKIRSSVRSVGDIAEIGLWRRCASSCAEFLETTSDGAGLLVNAAMERRGVRADHTHDISRLVSEFAKAKPHETSLTGRMAALNGKSQSHHIAVYGDEYDPEDFQTSVRRLVKTISLWSDEVADGSDAMSGQMNELAESALDGLGAWRQAVLTPEKEKSDEGNDVQDAASIILSIRPDAKSAISAFEERMRVVTGRSQ